MAGDITREQFIKFWGEEGFQQDFNHEYDCLDSVNKTIGLFSSEEKTVLEIGCGNGYWTKRLLVPRFGKVITVDVIDKPKHLIDEPNVEHHRLDEANYLLPSIPADSIDFVYSFGVFCHFTNRSVREYLYSMFRVMKHGAFAMVLFANWEHHPDFKNREAEYGTDPDPFCGWTCADFKTNRSHVCKAGFIWHANVITDFRDDIFIFQKPEL